MAINYGFRAQVRILSTALFCLCALCFIAAHEDNALCSQLVRVCTSLLPTAQMSRLCVQLVMGTTFIHCVQRGSLAQWQRVRFQISRLWVQPPHGSLPELSSVGRAVDCSGLMGINMSLVRFRQLGLLPFAMRYGSLLCGYPQLPCATSIHR